MKLLRGNEDVEVHSEAPTDTDAWSYQAEEFDDSNYFIRHWRGNLTLPVSYWINGGIVAWALVIITGLIFGAVTEAGTGLRAISFLGIAYILFVPVIWVWSVVGIWRSAGKHVDRGGSGGWAAVAKFMVIMGVLSMAGQMKTTLIPQFLEFSFIAAGRDPVGPPASIKISADGKSILVDGAIAEGTAGRFQTIVDSAPSAKTVVLNSQGGRIMEAKAMADLISAKGLSTYVERQCASACPLIFIAGNDRAAEPNARIGFHRSSFPGLSEAEIDDREVRQRYIDAGVAQSFVERAYTTSNSDMWYPTHEEMLDAGLISRTSLGGEVASTLSQLSNRTELHRAFLKVPLFRSFRQAYPDGFEEVISAAWTAHQSGGADGQISAAARAKFATYFPKIMANASDEDLDKYLTLVVEEINAAREVSVEACDKFTRGELDISRTLPPSLTAREMAILQSILDSAAVRRGLDHMAADEAIRQAMGSLSQRSINAIANPAQASPSDRCEANIDLYEALKNLDVHARTSALKLMLTSA